MVAKLREGLLVSKLVTQKFGVQRFCLRKVNNSEVKEQYEGRISKRFAALESMDDDVDVSRAWGEY